MLDALARASVEGALLAIAVWLVLRFVPRLSPAAKAVLWWCVAAKFLVALLPLSTVPLAVLPAAPGMDASRPASSATQRDARPAATGADRRAPTGRPPVDASSVLVSLWVIGLAVSVSRTAMDWRRTRRVISRSSRADDPTQRLVADVGAILGMTTLAELRYSSEIDSPLIAGVRRPVILVPAARFAQMSRESQRMIVCHELVHLGRRDVLFGCIPAAAERLFFFHPLMRLAAREYAFWREAACDAAVLAALNAPARSYGRLLLELGVSRQSTLAVAGAAMSFSTLKRRLVMLEAPFRPSTGARAVASITVALALVVMAPVRLVARQADEPRTPPAPAVASAATAAPASATPSSDAQPTAGAIRSAAGTAGASKPASTSPAGSGVDEGSVREELAFVLFDDESHGDGAPAVNEAASGSMRDVQRARELRERGEALLWFRLDGREYVVRDPSVLRAGWGLWERFMADLEEPVTRSSAEQGGIGASTDGPRTGDASRRVERDMLRLVERAIDSGAARQVR